MSNSAELMRRTEADTDALLFNDTRAGLLLISPLNPFTTAAEIEFLKAVTLRNCCNQYVVAAEY